MPLCWLKQSGLTDDIISVANGKVNFNGLEGCVMNWSTEFSHTLPGYFLISMEAYLPDETSLLCRPRSYPSEQGDPMLQVAGFLVEFYLLYSTTIHDSAPTAPSATSIHASHISMRRRIRCRVPRPSALQVLKVLTPVCTDDVDVFVFLGVQGCPPVPDA